MKHETAIPVGSGGMGEVFKAWDPGLERYVAFKYLKHDDPVLVERLLREARAQARIDHPSVCKVYEVGDDDGRPYIAMEFVDGVSLDVAAEKLTLEKKIVLVKAITEAVQAAHSAGLIHRDIKPANILVTDLSNGSHPYVLDFGIARMEEVAGLTNTGQVIGTPGYLSPEQARGDLAAIDRRTDVFSLGVILYELLSGAIPFHGDSNVEILMHLMKDEPELLRKRAPEVPRDLETVVMTCLEKDPERRYPSARALADDLGRFLDGEPVKARPIGLGERLTRRARKHPKTTALIALSVITILALSGFAQQTRRTSIERAELSRRLGTEIERISSTMRIAHLAPLHDLSPERAFVEERLEWIRAEMDRLGGLADGPGHYALGRGHLALGRPAVAREHLDVAWASGFTDPEVAQALGEAYTALYLAELEIVQRTRNAEARNAQVEALQAELRDPAVRFLQQGIDAPQASSSYVQALLALVDERFDDAIELARSAATNHEWLHEARVVEGRAHYQQGQRHLWEGGYDRARDEYLAAQKALEGAVEVGRSDPKTHEALCVNWHLVLEADRAEGRPIEAAYNEILTACGRAIEADPHQAAAYEKVARAHWRWGEQLAGRGDDPIPTYDKVIEAARNAVTANPACFRAANLEGLAWWRRGLYEDTVGTDPRPSLDQGVEALTTALGINPNYRHAHNNLGLIYWTKGRYEMRAGIDPEDSLRQAVAGYEGAIEVDPDYTYAYNNMAIVLRMLAEIEAGRWGEADPLFERSAETARGALDRNPRYANALNTLARALFVFAEYRIERGRSIGGLLEEAERSLASAVEINPSVADYHGGIAQCRLIAARELIANGEDPTDAFDAALAANEEAHAINPRFEGGKDQAGEIRLLQARSAARIGADPGRRLSQARRLFGQAAVDNPTDTAAYLGAARVARLEARVDAWLERDPEPALDAVRKAVSRAVTDSPTPATLIESARSDLVRARWRLSRGRNPEAALESAEKAAAEVREQVPRHPDAALLLAEIALLRYTHVGENDAGAVQALDDALKNAEHALSHRPTHPRTLAVRAALTIERAKLAGPSATGPGAAVNEFATLAANDELLRSEFARWIDDSLH